ncbi:four helix bundle protein [Nostoc sp. XA013]|nr:four helix bundle protein [Nostoc sp. XA013]
MTLAQQLLRSRTSIGANVEDAQAAQSKADFISKLMIALKESRETRYWLRLLIASEIVPQERISQLQTEAEELTKILGAIIISTKSSTKPLQFLIFNFQFLIPKRRGGDSNSRRF